MHRTSAIKRQLKKAHMNATPLDRRHTTDDAAHARGVQGIAITLHTLLGRCPKPSAFGRAKASINMMGKPMTRKERKKERLSLGCPSVCESGARRCKDRRRNSKKQTVDDDDSKAGRGDYTYVSAGTWYMPLVLPPPMDLWRVRR